MATFIFELVSPERLLLSREAESAVVPGSEGEMTVLARHAPVMTTLRPGLVTVTLPGAKTERFVVFGGFADILPDRCTLLAEASFALEEFDRAEITRRIEETRQVIADAKSPEHRTRLEEFLHQLTTLDGVIVPA